MSSMLYVPFWFVQLYLLIALIMHRVVCNYVIRFTRSGLWDGLTTRPLLVAGVCNSHGTCGTIGTLRLPLLVDGSMTDFGISCGFSILIAFSLT